MKLPILVAMWLGCALLGGGWLRADDNEIPSRNISFMYINQDKYRFGRPTMEEPLGKDGAEAIIALQIADGNTAVVITFDTNVYDDERLLAIRSVLTPWLLKLGARAIYYRELTSGDLIGKPLIVEAPIERDINAKTPATRPQVPAPVIENDSPIARPQFREPITLDDPGEIIVNQPQKIRLRPLTENPVNSGTVYSSAPAVSATPAAPATLAAPAASEKPLAEELDLLNPSAPEKKTQSPIAALAITKPDAASEPEEIDDPLNQRMDFPVLDDAFTPVKSSGN